MCRCRRRPRPFAQELAQLDDMRLGRGMADLGEAWRRRRGQQRGFGGCHGCLVQVHRCRPQPVRRLQPMPGDVRDARAHRASAARCVLMVRRAGKSPPGGASIARPRRASSGPRSSTEPRKRPTSAGSGSSFVTSRTPHAHRRRADAVDFGAEIQQQPRHHLDVGDARHVGEHAFFGRSRHAASSGSAAFLLPSTSTGPDSGGRLQSAGWTCESRESLADLNRSRPAQVRSL